MSMLMYVSRYILHILFLQTIDKSKFQIDIHVYQLTNEGGSAEVIEEDEEISAANHWILPSGNYISLFKFFSIVFQKEYSVQ